jgi:hypothetical protein
VKSDWLATVTVKDSWINEPEKGHKNTTHTLNTLSLARQRALVMYFFDSVL